MWLSNLFSGHSYFSADDVGNEQALIECLLGDSWEIELGNQYGESVCDALFSHIIILCTYNRNAKFALGNT